MTTRLNKFIDNFAAPTGGYGVAAGNVTPDVTASLQVCPENATGGQAADEAGRALHRRDLRSARARTPSTSTCTGDQTTTSQVAGNTHADNADPFANFVRQRRSLPGRDLQSPVPASPPTPAIPSPTDATMIGATKVTVDFARHRRRRLGLQLNSRLYDVLPDGTAVMVDRGPRRVTLSETDSQPADRPGHLRAARQRLALPDRAPDPDRDRPGRPAVRQAQHACVGDRRSRT